MPVTMHTITNDEMVRIWMEKAVVCVQVPLQYFLGRPDKKHDRNISELISTLLKDGVSTMYVRHCIMMHK
jgi:hypothetical protein